MILSKNCWLLSALLLCALVLSAQEAPSPKVDSRQPFTLGETLLFSSSVFNEERSINVYLPASYQENTTKKYPVIYLLDGSADEDFIHVAGLIQFATFPWINMLPESILVGIANVDRKRDFTYPTNNAQDKTDFPTTGGSAAFIDFLERELQPLVNTTYRTVDTTTLIGQSLGGLVATEILFEQPALFDNYLIISPSLWWDDESLLARSPDLSAVSGQIYLAVGEEGAVMKRTAYELLTKLMKANLNVHFEFLDDQDHGNILHQAIYRAFGFMYRKGE